MRYLTHSSVAQISASAELRAVMVYLLDIQCSGPLVYMMKPDRERLLKSSSGGSFGFGFDWSWGPQLASVKGVVVWGSIRNFTKEDKLLLMRLWNAIPMDLVPLIWRRLGVLWMLCVYVEQGGLWSWRYLVWWMYRAIVNNRLVSASWM